MVAFNRTLTTVAETSVGFFSYNEFQREAFLGWHEGSTISSRSLAPSSLCSTIVRMELSLCSQMPVAAPAFLKGKGGG